MRISRLFIAFFFLLGTGFVYSLPDSEALFAWNILDLSSSNLSDTEKGGENCKACHQKVLDEIGMLPFKHSNIVSTGCEKCHLASRGRRSASNRYLNKDEWRRVQFINYSDEHLAVLNNLDENKKYSLKVSFKDRNGRIGYIDSLSFIPSEIVEYWTDDKMPPVIKKAGVQKIDVSVLTSAEIAVETDELSSVKIEYGPTEKYGFFLFDRVFRKRHILRLNGLALKRSYHYRVVATDSFGNRSISADYEFITSGPFQAEEKVLPEPVNKEDISSTLKILKYTENRVRVQGSGGSIKKISRRGGGSRLALLFNADRDVTLILKYLAVKEEHNGGVPGREKHGEWGLRSQKEAGIDACKECHSQGASHPVGMPAKGDTVIPNNLPTGEGGIMTCATCHSPHGGQFRYLARIDFGGNGCAVCHKGDFF